MTKTESFNTKDVNCFCGKEGTRFLIAWETDEDGAFGPEVLRYERTEISPMFNGGFRFVFQGPLKDDNFYLFPGEIRSVGMVT